MTIESSERPAPTTKSRGWTERLRGSAVGLLRATQRLLVLCVIVGIALGFLAWLFLGPQYSSSSDVLVRPISSEPFAAQDATTQLSMRTEAAVAQSEAIEARVATENGYPQNDVPGTLRVTNPTDTTLLSFEVTTDNPDESARLANAFAAAYLADREQRTVATVKRIERALEKEMAALAKESAAVASRGGAAAAAQLQVLSDQTVAIKERQVETRSLDTNPGEVVAAAIPPSGRSTPSLPVWLILGFALGLIAGLFLLWIRPVLLHALEPPAVGSVRGQ